MPTILVVEDYPSIQEIYKTALKAEGYDVRVAADGKEALELVKTWMPDIILLDLLMANIGGLEFLRSFQPSKHPETKVVVFSNLSSPELAKEALELGSYKYLTKSNFTPGQLAELIKQILTSHSSSK